MDKEFTPADITALKKQINDDLDVLIKRFNEDYEMWAKRTQCEANFRWVFDTSSGARKLAKESVTFPVYQEPASEEAVQKAVDILSKACPE